MNDKMTEEHKRVISDNREFLFEVAKDLLEKVRGKTDVKEILEQIFVCVSALYVFGYNHGKEEGFIQQKKPTVN